MQKSSGWSRSGNELIKKAGQSDAVNTFDCSVSQKYGWVDVGLEKPDAASLFSIPIFQKNG